METMPTNLAFAALPKGARERMERACGLRRRESEHRVFVYGTLLAGECNAHRAGRARRQKAWVAGTLHDTLCRFPAFVNRGRTHVKGEVLTVDDAALASMDRLEGCPHLYRRERIRAHLVGGGCVLAWVYIMNRLPDGAPVIESGDWIAYRKAGYANPPKTDERR